MTEDEMRKRLESLRIEHRDLDAAIDALTESGSTDQLQIARLKKRKLRLKERGIPVLLAGMLAPPNMGADYAERFNGIYKRLSEKHGVPLYPFFLEGVVTRADLQIEDGMHPNPAGVDVMVQSILPTAEAFLKSISTGE